MSILPVVRDFVAEQKGLLHVDLNLVANNIVEYIQEINRSEYAAGNVWGSREIDDLVVDVGNRVWDTLDSPDDKNKKTKTYVYIATELHKTGGHTPALLRIAESKTNYKHIVFVTDILEGFDSVAFDDHLVASTNIDVEIIVVPEVYLIEKIKWLQAELKEISPEALFLFNHHEDVVAIAASHEKVCGDIYFYHHTDHHLALGVFVEHFVHIDPHNIGYTNCREHLNLTDNIYWPLVSNDYGCRDSKVPFMQGGELRTCTCAGANKIEENYAYLYKDVVLGRLKSVHGRHYHVGWLTDEYLEEIRAGLRDNKIDESRFIYTQWVDSVWLFLLENNIDLYVSSFPLGGGTTTIECMGSGTPVIMHDTYKTKFHGGIDIAYGDVMRWSVPGELYEILHNLSSDVLSECSLKGREHYLKYYQPELLRKVLSDENSMRVGVVPPCLSVQESDIDSVIKKINTLESEDSCFSYMLNAIRKEREIAVSDRNALINERDAVIVERNRLVAERNKLVAERNKLNAEWSRLVAERDTVIDEVNALYASRSWKITKPLRMICGKIKRSDTDD